MGQKLQLKKLGNGELQHLIKISNLTHQMGTLIVNFSSKTEESSQFRKEYSSAVILIELVTCSGLSSRYHLGRFGYFERFGPWYECGIGLTTPTNWWTRLHLT